MKQSLAKIKLHEPKLPVTITVDHLCSAAGLKKLPQAPFKSKKHTYIQLGGLLLHTDDCLRLNPWNVTVDLRTGTAVAHPDWMDWLNCHQHLEYLDRHLSPHQAAAMHNHDTTGIGRKDCLLQAIAHFFPEDPAAKLEEVTGSRELTFANGVSFLNWLCQERKIRVYTPSPNCLVMGFTSIFELPDKHPGIILDMFDDRSHITVFAPKFLYVPILDEQEEMLWPDQLLCDGQLPHWREYAYGYGKAVPANMLKDEYRAVAYPISPADWECEAVYVPRSGGHTANDPSASVYQNWTAIKLQGPLFCRQVLDLMEKGKVTPAVDLLTAEFRAAGMMRPEARPAAVEFLKRPDHSSLLQQADSVQDLAPDYPFPLYPASWSRFRRHVLAQ